MITDVSITLYIEILFPRAICERFNRAAIDRATITKKILIRYNTYNCCRHVPSAGPESPG